jgi:hypothetical protein
MKIISLNLRVSCSPGIGQNVAVPYVGKLLSLHSFFNFEFIVLLDFIWFKFILLIVFCLYFNLCYALTLAFCVTCMLTSVLFVEEEEEESF